MIISTFSNCTALNEIEFPTLDVDSIHSRLCIKLQTFLIEVLHPTYTLSCLYNPTTKKFYIVYSNTSEKNLHSLEMIFDIISTRLLEYLDIKVSKINVPTMLVFKLSKKKEQEILMTLKILGY